MSSTIIEDVEKIDLSDYDSFYRVDIDIDGNKTSILVGRKISELGFGILSGHDILKFFDSEENVYKVVADKISELQKTVKEVALNLP